MKRTQRLSLKHPVGLLILTLAFMSCGKTGQTNGTVSTTAALAPDPASYTPRIGIGVKTDARTCIAIHNGDLTTGSPVTLISPIAPATVLQGTVGGVSQQPCPIAQNVDTTVSNYIVDVNGSMPKLTPFVVVVGTPPVTMNANNMPQSDIGQNGHPATFRACSADDGIHLTAWSGAPLQGTLVWQGLYYEQSNPDIGPPCSKTEIPAS